MLIHGEGEWKYFQVLVWLTGKHHSRDDCKAAKHIYHEKKILLAQTVFHLLRVTPWFISSQRKMLRFEILLWWNYQPRSSQLWRNTFGHLQVDGRLESMCIMFNPPHYIRRVWAFHWSICSLWRVGSVFRKQCTSGYVVPSQIHFHLRPCVVYLPLCWRIYL